VLITATAAALLMLMRVYHQQHVRFVRFPAMSRAVARFPLLLASALAVISADVATTLIGVWRFGLDVEANRIVMSLLRGGAALEWLGQYFSPTIISGLLFALINNAYVRVLITFFMLGTLIYTTWAVANNILVIVSLAR